MSKPPAHRGPPPAPSAANVKVGALAPQVTSSSLNTANEQRTQAVKEILSTEESYHKALESIVQLYIQPLNQALNSGKSLLTQNEIKIIFGQSEMLWRFHTEFLKELTPLIKNWSNSQCIGGLFEKNAEVFKLYTPYVNSYPEGAYLLAEKQKKDKALNAFLREQQLKTINKLDLPSLLIMPIQRIPRYRMLLEVILKNTQPTHPDYASLANALEKIKVVAEAINEKKKKAEMIQKVTEIQDQFEDELNLIESFRVFVAEGTVTYHPKRDASGELFSYFLFNDKILLAVAKGKKLKLRDTLYLVSTEIKDAMDTSTIKNAFELITSQSSYLLALPTLKQKEDFIKDFYLQRSRAAALLSGPKLAVETQKASGSGSSSGSPSGSQIADDKADKERERKERKEREKREREKEKEKEERERLERREREERGKREQTEAELARMKLELAKVQEQAKQQELLRQQTTAAMVQATRAPAPPSDRAPALPKTTPAPTSAKPKPNVSIEEACAACGEELEGKLMRVGNNRWHKTCFKCLRCKGDVPAEFNVEDGWPVCDSCYASSSATRCPGCNQPIVDKYVKFNNKEWHKECILCYKCKKGFVSLGAIEVEKGMPVHADC